jgi:hypothetical protein
MPKTRPPLTLYVQSHKAVTTFYRPSRPVLEGAGTPSADVGPTDETTAIGEQAFFLSDDQARAVALVEELAAQRGYTVEVKDVARVGRLERMMTEVLRRASNFPVLVSPDGVRIEGAEHFTEERLCEMMPTEMPQQRAFTYIKIRGGDLDAVRHAMLGFHEVREVHFLTGDWDAFIVLEFAAAETSKRQILDFVTQHIRSMGAVVDTSTLVPEVSVTKFPI